MYVRRQYIRLPRPSFAQAGPAPTAPPAAPGTAQRIGVAQARNINENEHSNSNDNDNDSDNHDSNSDDISNAL